MSEGKQIPIKVGKKSIVPPSEKEMKSRKIKNIKRHIRKIEDAKIDELPLLFSKLLSYLLKKEIVKDETFIKYEIKNLIFTIINSYKYNFNPNEPKRITDFLLLFSPIISNHSPKNTENINKVAEMAKSSFFASKYVLDSYYKNRYKS